jgi:hypothetical protein
MLPTMLPIKYDAVMLPTVDTVLAVISPVVFNKFVNGLYVRPPFAVN